MAAEAQAGSASADIFGAAAKGTKDQPKEKRFKLKNVDSVAAKCLDPWDVSLLDDTDLPQLWGIVQKGDKYAHFFSNLAAQKEEHNGKYRVGVGMSQHCEVCINSIEQLKSNDDLRKCLDKKVLGKAVEEGNALLPHLKVLNAGKGSLSEPKEESFGQLRYKRKASAQHGTIPTPQQVETAAK
eukprot:12419547-Karenia_brevis.AAC.1